MSRAEFMEKLEYLLQDLSQEDREDGIAFYRDYLDEAGTEREQEVLREFGSPERIASSSGAIYKLIWKTAAFLARMGLRMSVSGSLGTRW